MKLSVIIIAFDEEEEIRECLESVKWADEIIFVDSESTDRTREIASEYTDKVIVHKWKGFAAQKQFALDNASNEWVLSIDADERVTPELKDEIVELLGSNPEFNGYFIPRRNHFLGKEIKSCGWSPDYQLRLFKKSKTVVDRRKVHEGFLVEGERGHLTNAFIHFTHNNLYETFAKINQYSTLEAEELYLKKKARPINIFINPIAAFLSHYIYRKGYRDGVHGLMVSLIHSLTKKMTYMKIWDLQNRDKAYEKEDSGRSRK